MVDHGHCWVWGPLAMQRELISLRESERQFAVEQVVEFEVPNIKVDLKW